MVGDAQISKFEREADEVCYKVRRMDSSVDEDGAVDVWMTNVGEDRGLFILT